MQKISPPFGFDPRTVQLVASGYTDCPNPGHDYKQLFIKCCMQITQKKEVYILLAQFTLV